MKDYEELIAPNGISVKETGVNDCALDKETALIGIDILRSANIPILVGDVFKSQNNELYLTYDNWYCEEEDYSSYDEYLKTSWDKAKNYLIIIKSMIMRRYIFV